ncbi:MAG: hypothetical protein PHW56_00680 [Methanosarcinaceae archaeon]|nr:hypothetical protein [Methanosarcinaceae archaeon]
MGNILLIIIRLSIFETFCVTGLLILIGLILGLLESRANFYILKTFGLKGILATACIGTPVHETGHLLMCLLFRHKINEFRLLDLKSRNGILGYVKHSWDIQSPYQNVGNFFIGMGPIFSGTAVLVLGMYFLLPSAFENFGNYLTLDPARPDFVLLGKMFKLTWELLGSIFSMGNLARLNFWLYFVLAISVSSHMALSKADLKGSAMGLVTIFFLILLANVTALIFKTDISGFFNGVLTLNVYLLAFSTVSISFSFLRLGLSFSAYVLVNR